MGGGAGGRHAVREPAVGEGAEGDARREDAPHDDGGAGGVVATGHDGGRLAAAGHGHLLHVRRADLHGRPPAEEGGEHLVKGGSVFELSHVNSTALSELDQTLSPAELGAWINAFKKPIKVTLVPEGAPAPAPAPNEEPAKASLGGNFALPDKKDTAPKMPCVA